MIELAPRRLERTLPAATPAGRHPTPLVVAVVMAGTLLARFAAGALVRSRSSDPYVIGMMTLRQIDKATRGRSSRHITARLGNPAATVPGLTPVWYYKVENDSRRVLAITLVNGRAVRVELITPPV